MTGGCASARKIVVVDVRAWRTLHSFTEGGDVLCRISVFAISGRFVPDLGKRMQSHRPASGKTTFPACRGAPLGAPTRAPNTGSNRLVLIGVGVTAVRAYFSMKYRDSRSLRREQSSSCHLRRIIFCIVQVSRGRIGPLLLGVQRSD